jgi:tellurite resistance protein
MNVTKQVSEGSSVDQMIKDLITQHEIMLFSKTTCAFSLGKYDFIVIFSRLSLTRICVLELKRTLGQFAVAFSVFECDESPQMVAVQQALLQMTGSLTVPQLFIKGEYKGGCETMKGLEFTGELQAMLAPYIGKYVPKDVSLTRFSLFYCPEFVNKNVVRVSGVMTFCYCILCAGFYDRLTTPWAVLALAIDFLLRLVYGSSCSVIGMVAVMLCSRYHPVYSAGPPKQFASACGTLMAIWAAGLYIAGYDSGGAVIIVALAIATGAEGFFDFCFGCLFFGMFLRAGLISKTLYVPYLNFVNVRKWAWFYTNAKDDYPKAESERLLMPWQTEPTSADLIRKNRLDTEYKLRDFDPIRHCRVDFFSIPMAICALALAWKFAGNDVTKFDTYRTYQALAIISVIVFFPLLILYVLRIFMYPKKVIKEWNHPVTGNFFSSLSIYSVILGICWLADDHHAGGTLIWMGAIVQMAITVFRVGDLVYDRIADDTINASLMMAPVGNFIAAFAFPYYHLAGYIGNYGQANYVQIGRLWFGVAVLYAIVLFTITFKKSLHDHHADNRLRPLLWVWFATSSIAGPAYFAVTGFEPGVASGVLFQSLWSISLLFLVINSYGWIRNFYSYVPDVSIWVMPFASSAFALNTVLYQQYNDGPLFRVLAVVTISIACASTAVCGLHTLTSLVDMSMFKPRPKWNPINFMKLTHEAFRFALPKYQTILMALTPANTNAAELFLRNFEGLMSAHAEHSRHEDVIIFPMVRRYFPGLAAELDKEHDEIDGYIHKIRDLIKDYRSQKIDLDPLLSQLKELYPKWANLMLPHLRSEEETVTVVARKYLPIESVIQIVRAVYDLTTITEWRVVMPFIVENLPMPM